MNRTSCFLTFTAVLALSLSSASAAPLHYGVNPPESNLAASLFLDAFVNLTPDPTETPILDPDGEFPLIVNGTTTTNTFPTLASKVVADVGLPGSFNGGAAGIDFSELIIDYAQVPGQQIVFGIVPLPLGLGNVLPPPFAGASALPLVLNAQVTSLNITLDDPFSSSLTPTGNPNEWLWSGLANVTVSGELHPNASIPGSGMEPVALPPTPFSQATTVALAGTFSGDGTGSDITVGIPIDAFENLDLSLPSINEQVALAELLGELGLPEFLIDLSFNNLVLGDTNGSVLFENATPIPEPASAALLWLGLAGLAARRRG